MRTKHARKLRLLILVHRHTAASKNSFAKPLEEPTNISNRLGEALETFWGEEKNGYGPATMPGFLERLKDFWEINFNPTLSDRVNVRVHKREYGFMLIQIAKEKERLAISHKQFIQDQLQRDAILIKYLIEEELEESSQLNPFVKQREIGFQKIHQLALQKEEKL